MGRRGRRKRLPEEPVEVVIESLSHDGKGVAHIDGKATFIHGGLTDEKVMFKYTAKKKKYDEGSVVEVLSPSPDRVEPGCENFDICGGCSLQHLEASKQIESKQQILLDALTHIGKVTPETVLPPLVNKSSWGYRRKARLGVKDVPKKGRVLVGFRERGSNYIANIERCPVLHPAVGEKLTHLSTLIEGLSIHNKLPQIEVAMDDSQCVLIFRVLEEPNAEDLEKFRQFGIDHDFIIYLQSGGPDTVIPLDDKADLHYALPDFNLELHFLPNDFTQVNSAINRQMLTKAVDMLELTTDDNVLDLFCGIGNFTLPLATKAKKVTGVEGDDGLVKRALANAKLNNLDNVDFHVANLYESLDGMDWAIGQYNKVLIDPPRSGAQEVLPLLKKLGADRLVYVSCYPGTLARDAGILVNELGYKLVSAGVMDMFPHTAHVESIALFERSK